MNIDDVIRALAQKRPIFHSEADFQHALAWQIKLLETDVEVRLEIPAEFGDQERAFIDMLARRNGSATFFELKYKTALTEVTHENERFRLRRQGAQDQGKYDFLKDIARIESFVHREPNSSGYAILITNDPAYWTPRLKTNSIDAEFELSEGRVITGELRWAANAGIGSIRGRETPVTLRGHYSVNWQDYPSGSIPGCSPFRYLCFGIAPTTRDT